MLPCCRTIWYHFFFFFALFPRYISSFLGLFYDISYELYNDARAAPIKSACEKKQIPAQNFVLVDPGIFLAEALSRVVDLVLRYII